MVSLCSKAALFATLYPTVAGNVCAGDVCEEDGAFSFVQQRSSRILNAEQQQLFITLNDGAKLSTDAGPWGAWGIDRIDNRSGIDRDFAIWGNAGKRVNVYVLSTGVFKDHGVFQNKKGTRVVPTWDYTKMVADPVCATNGKADCANDEDGAGTSAASIIAGDVLGIARGATIHAVKVARSMDSASDFSVSEGLKWVTENAISPAVIYIDISSRIAAKFDVSHSDCQRKYHAGINYVASNCDELTKSKAAIAEAIKKFPVIVPAGDSVADACNGDFASTEAISVGATNREDKRYSGFKNGGTHNWYYIGSSYGSCIDIWAPGENVLAGVPGGDNNMANVKSGTRLAASHVAGVATMYLTAFPSATHAQVKQYLLDTATMFKKMSNEWTQLEPISPLLFFNTTYFKCVDKYGTLAYPRMRAVNWCGAFKKGACPKRFIKKNKGQVFRPCKWKESKCVPTNGKKDDGACWGIETLGKPYK